MSHPCITIPSVEVPHFDKTDFVSWKSQISTYLREMNTQVWWMVDVGRSNAWRIALKHQRKRNAYISKPTHLILYLVP
jgi:hypothetical protein